MEERIVLQPQTPFPVGIFSRIASWLTLETLWFLAVPLGVMCVQNLNVVPPNDFWWHVRTGQIILETGSIPSVDLFSFTQSGQPWVNQAWLMQVALYLLYTTGGLPLVIFVHAVTITAGYTLVLRHVTQYYGLRIGAAATMLGVVVGISSTTVRPQSISFLFFGILMYLVESHRQGHTRRLWLVIPLFALWVNSHGAFVFGLGVLGVYVVGRLWEHWRADRPAEENTEIKRVMLIGLLSLHALAFNPEGPVGIIQYVLGFFQSKATIAYNIEFAPLVIRDATGMIFFGSLLLLVIAVVRSGVRLRPDQVINVVLFAVLALWATRGAVWYGFVLIPVLATGMRAWLDRPRPASRHRPWLNAFIFSALGLLFIVSLPWLRDSLPFPPSFERRELTSVTTPRAATEFLCDTLPDEARVFQEIGFASYQVWACPRLPVFADTRIELYPLEQWEDYLVVQAGIFGWQEILDTYDVTHLFLSIEQEHLITAAIAADEWHEIYGDSRAVIFARQQ